MSIPPIFLREMNFSAKRRVAKNRRFTVFMFEVKGNVPKWESQDPYFLFRGFKIYTFYFVDQVSLYKPRYLRPLSRPSSTDRLGAMVKRPCGASGGREFEFRMRQGLLL